VTVGAASGVFGLGFARAAGAGFCASPGDATRPQSAAASAAAKIGFIINLLPRSRASLRLGR
jgi:hypothetical protein